MRRLSHDALTRDSRLTAVHVRAMPEDGAITLSGVREPTLAIVCQPFARRGRYAVVGLLEEHCDAKLTDLFQTLADCPKARSASI